MKRISEEWLKAAKDDLIVIEKIIDDEHLTHMVAFHSQQCIEKSLKAIIEEYEMGHMRIHNLERLFEIVKPHLSFDIDIVQIENLDKLYTLMHGTQRIWASCLMASPPRKMRKASMNRRRP